jgi:sugar phosphate isomerase/epimerase
LSNYGKRIGNIHIKDCTPEDYSVKLGKGNVNFELSFEWFRRIGYTGDFILQAVRGKNDFELANDFYQFTNHYIQKYFK